MAHSNFYIHNPNKSVWSRNKFLLLDLWDADVVPQWTVSLQPSLQFEGWLLVGSTWVVHEISGGILSSSVLATLLSIS